MNALWVIYKLYNTCSGIYLVFMLKQENTHHMHAPWDVTITWVWKVKEKKCSSREGLYRYQVRLAQLIRARFSKKVYILYSLRPDGFNKINDCTFFNQRGRGINTCHFPTWLCKVNALCLKWTKMNTKYLCNGRSAKFYILEIYKCVIHAIPYS